MNKFLLSFILGLMLSTGYSQQVITAKIMDAETNAAVPNAVITLQGDTSRFISNKLGFFQLTADTTDYIIISHDRYESGTIKVPARENFAVQLIPLDESQVSTIATEYEKGRILDFYRLGVWEYFDEPNKLALKIDYDRNQILYLEPDSSEYAIEIDGEFVIKKVDRQPRYLGSDSEIYKAIGATIAYPGEARAYGIQGTFYVAFTIGVDGEMQHFQVLNGLGYNCGRAAVGALKQVPERWLPAMLNNTAYPTRFILPFKFVLEGETAESVVKNDDSIMPTATYWDEFVVTAVVD